VAITLGSILSKLVPTVGGSGPDTRRFSGALGLADLTYPFVIPDAGLIWRCRIWLLGGSLEAKQWGMRRS